MQEMWGVVNLMKILPPKRITVTQHLIKEQPVLCRGIQFEIAQMTRELGSSQAGAEDSIIQLGCNNIWTARRFQPEEEHRISIIYLPSGIRLSDKRQ